MSALITIADLEAILNDTADADQTALWTFLINTVSNYVNNHVDVSFVPVEDELRRFKCDHYGEIQLPGPVTGITSVLDWRTQQPDPWVDWDGMHTLYYLLPEQVVDVTWSYGYASVPDDIKNLVSSLVLQLAGETGSSVTLTLSEYKVGDVDEKYVNGMIVELMDDMAMETLNKYVYEAAGYTINTAGSDGLPDYRGQGFLTDNF